MGPFISDAIYVKETPDMGFGVFTTRDIEAGHLIEVSPIIVFPKSIIDTAYFISMAEGMKPRDIILDQYAILVNDNESAIMLGYLSIYNHNDIPNAEIVIISERKAAVKTTQPISANSQIFISYGPNWFESKKSYIDKI